MKQMQFQIRNKIFEIGPKVCGFSLAHFLLIDMLKLLFKTDRGDCRRECSARVSRGALTKKGETLTHEKNG